MRELSLRPYNGRLYLASSLRDYKKSHKILFKEEDFELQIGARGHTTGRCNSAGEWTYLIWSEGIETLAHELAHVILHMFQRCGIDPRDANGEPFCYMLSQLMLDSKTRR